MLRIGDFSRMAQVTIVALRHYDQMGLLKPVKIDSETGYRYYSVAQLPRLNRILFLKDLGFNLEQIGRLLDDNLPVEQMVGMLKLKQAEVEQQVALEQARLSQIEARLHLIQNENQLPSYEVLIKKVEPLRVLSIRDTIDAYGDVAQLWRELKAYMRHHGFGWVYPNLAIWQEIEYREQDIGVEAGVPFAGAIPANERIKTVVLPGLEMVASVIHQGDYNGLTQAYEVLMKWNELNGYRVSGAIRELYHNYDRVNPQNNITEIQLSVAKI
ncbi:MAG TPA: GyrI-like domain-containing protein [Chloroflexia bacterium]|nr:GyrI-like domain-containing protein [Chloroflexia bacterium]